MWIWFYVQSSYCFHKDFALFYVHLAKTHGTTQKGREEEKQGDLFFQISGGTQMVKHHYQKTRSEELYFSNISDHEGGRKVLWLPDGLRALPTMLGISTSWGRCCTWFGLCWGSKGNTGGSWGKGREVELEERWLVSSGIFLAFGASFYKMRKEKKRT